MFKAEHITVQYRDFTAAKDVSFSVEEGQWLMLVGPNGAGKSSLIRSITADMNYSGDVFYRGRNLRDMKPTERARAIGVFMQNHNVGYAYSVEEIVRLGRYAYASHFLADCVENDRMVEMALEMTGMKELADHSVLTLSGGEIQRCFLAQALAQDPNVLILDEPTNHLDMGYQKQIFELVSEWVKEPGRCVISVVHDLSLAKRYGSHALLLKNGNVVAYGEINQVFSEELLNDVYEMNVSDWMRGLYAQW